ncbi:unnamed protein product [Allacma fusca]|uniref:Uncharacterized protein n=1 Tax=Allacma fusca TaxID=39272 RepID=A0A8J2KU10_9HEXA|nr:unnamed protein product [Allacma fusca]
MTELQILLLFGIILLCLIVGFGMLELITCCLQPGYIRSLCSGTESANRRKRLLSIYDIYNSAAAQNDIIFNVKDTQGSNIVPGRLPTNMKRGSFSRTLPTIPTILEKNEEPDHPPTYAEVMTETHIVGKVPCPSTIPEDVKIV